VDSELEFLWQCQKQAALWLYQRRRKELSDGRLRLRLEQLPELEREETRKWLNYYNNQDKEKSKHVNPPTISRNRRKSTSRSFR